MKSIHLTALAMALLTANSLLALPDPIACWKADGDAQAIPDGKTRVVHSEEIDYKQGVAGKAFSFNGKTSEFEAELIPSSLTFPAMTWSVWIRPTRPTEPAHSQTILSATYYVLSIQNDQLVIYANGRSATSPEPVKWGIWQHVAVVFALDHATIYHKGKATTTRKITTPLTTLSLNRLNIGCSGNDYSRYSGLIDHVAIYDRELTPAEIAELAIRPKESSPDDTTKPDAKTPDKSPTKSVQEWTNTEGKVITAAFVRLDGEAVVVKNGGKEFRIPFAKLAAASVQRAKSLAAREQADASPAPVPAAPTQSGETKQAVSRANPPDSLALDLSVPKPPTPKHWHWPHQGGGSYALGMPSQSKIQSLWGALQITTAQMDRLMALWQETVINACNEDEKQFHPAVAKFALEREAILTPAQKDTRQRIVKYYAELATRLKAQGLAGEELSLKAAEQARKDLPTLLTPQETDCWHTVEDARQRAGAEKAAK